MRKIILFYGLTLIFSCQNKQSEVKPIYYEPVPIENTIAPEPVKQSKFYFMVLVTEQPTGIYTTEYDYKKHIERRIIRHTTDIDEVIADVNEDFKYRELDNAERDLRENLFKRETHRYNQIVSAWNIQGANTECKLITRDFYFYNSYAEASKARENLLKINTE